MRQLASILVSDVLATAWFTRGFDAAIIESRALPPDAEMVDASFSAEGGGYLKLTFRSASFGPLEEGATPPIIDGPLYRRP